MIYLFADTHFHHDNIIKFCRRPFDDIETMNKTLIDNWQETVMDSDDVYFLGDFAMGRHSRERDRRLFELLPGIKTLVLGNHDTKFRLEEGDKVTNANSLDYWREVGFVQVSKLPLVLENFFVLSHYPMDGFFQGQPFVNIHGHTHAVKLINGQYFNVGADAVGFRPISLDKIKELLNESGGELS